MKDYKNSIFKLQCDCIKRSYSAPWNVEYYNSGGTGFAISIKNKPYILTCYHVVTNAEKIIIGDIECKLIFKSKLLDLALLEYSGYCEPLLFGEVTTGESIQVMGFPYTHTYFNIAYTSGIVSRLTKINFGIGKILAYQIDAAAFPGNSGCPVLNMNGKVCGVLFAGHNTSDILNFIIPYFSIKYFIDAYENGTITYKIPDFTWQIVDNYMGKDAQLLIDKKTYVNTIEGIPLQENGTIKLKDFLQYYGYHNDSEEDIPFIYLITFCDKSKILLDNKQYKLNTFQFEFDKPEWYIFGDFVFVPTSNGFQSEVQQNIEFINGHARTAIVYSVNKMYNNKILDIAYVDLVKKLEKIKKTIIVDFYSYNWILTLNPEDKKKSHIKKLFSNLF